MTVASQTSPPKATPPQNYLVPTEQSPRNQLGKELLPFLICSMNRPTDIQEPEEHTTTTANEETIIPPLAIAARLIEGGLIRDKETNEVYLPLTSTVVL